MAAITAPSKAPSSISGPRLPAHPPFVSGMPGRLIGMASTHRTTMREINCHVSPATPTHILRLATPQCDVLDLSNIGKYADLSRARRAPSSVDGPMLRIKNPGIVAALPCPSGQLEPSSL